MSQKLKKTLSVICLVGIGVGIGYYLMPSKTVEVEKIVEKERVKTVTITKEKKNADGSTEKETVVKEDTKKEMQTDKSKTVLKNDPQWMVGMTVGKDTNWETAYGGVVSKRILGPVWGGVYLIPTGTKAQGGFMFTYEF